MSSQRRTLDSSRFIDPRCALRRSITTRMNALLVHTATAPPAAPKTVSTPLASQVPRSLQLSRHIPFNRVCHIPHSRYTWLLMDQTDGKMLFALIERIVAWHPATRSIIAVSASVSREPMKGRDVRFAVGRRSRGTRGERAPQMPKRSGNTSTVSPRLLAY